MDLTLWGYRYSVYAWIARLVLREKGVAHAWHEVNPFDPDAPESYLDLHPFNRVPTLVHDGFALYETAAITQYADEAFDGPALQPADPRERARMRQIVGVIDSYGYRPLVRQVFAHGAFRPRLRESADPAQVEAGLAASETVLAALERLAGDGPFLLGERVGLADLHLAPMLAYFAEVEAAREQLDGCPKLAAWWQRMANRPAVVETRPPLPG